jgi:uncharacterized peroxidase-related enzyme
METIMRLAILDSGHTFGSKILFAMIGLFSGQRVVDAVKLARYRADFYGRPMGKVVHEAMRGPSAWSVGDRELMAAFISKANECVFCIKAHTAVSKRAYGESTKVEAVLSNVETAPIGEPLRATLRMLGKLARERTVNADDMRAVLAAGASREQIADALAVSFGFEVTNRLANTFDFAMPEPAAMEAGAKFLLSRGYR